MQFRLSTILLAFVVVAMSLAMGHVAWVVLALILVACLGIPESLLRGIAILGLLTLPVICLLPVRSSAREAARRSHCANNLKQLAIGLHSYHDTYGTFPPACVRDENGTPMHSWRTLVLPYVEQEPLYRRYRFDEPWNGPNNSALSSGPPGGYLCYSDLATYSDPNATKGVTSYVAVLGPKSLWGNRLPASKPLAGKVFMLCEWPGSGIHWMEPRDLCQEDIGLWLQAFSQQNRGHGTVINVATADGAVRSLAFDEVGDMLQAAFGDELTDNERRMLDEYTSEAKRQVRWAAMVRHATPIAWLASIIIMIIHLRAIRRKRPALP